MKLSRFLESISAHEYMPITRYDNTLLFSAILILLTLTLVSLAFKVCYHNCVHKNEYHKKNKAFVTCCCATLWVLIIAMLLLLIFPLKLFPSVYESGNLIVCEATRIPHSFVEGQYDPQYIMGDVLSQGNSKGENIEATQHQTNGNTKGTEIKFIGIETISDWINVFIGHAMQMSFELLKENLESIEKVGIHGLIEDMIGSENDFFETFRVKEINKGTGEMGIPSTISRHLAYFHSFMLTAFPKYTQLTKRLQGVDVFYKQVEKQENYDSYFAKLKQIHFDFSKLQIALLDFWNDLIFQSLFHLEKLKLYLVIILGIVLINVLFILGLAGTYCSANHKKRLVNLRGYRAGVFFGLMLLIICLVLLLQYLRVTFTTSYGCSLMFKLKTIDIGFDSSIEGHLHFPTDIQRLFDTCLLKQGESGLTSPVQQNLYSEDVTSKLKETSVSNWLTEDASKDTLLNFVGFSDSFKALLEDWNMGAQAQDQSPFDDLVQELETAGTGNSDQFPEVSLRLESLNQIYSCTPFVYRMTELQCQKLESPTNCLSVEKSELAAHECLKDYQTTESLFNNLKDYLKQTKSLANQMLSRLSGNNDSSSVFGKFSRVWQYISFIQEKLTFINSHISLKIFNLAPGSLVSFLDCSLVRSDIEAIFGNLCRNKLADLLAFADLFSGLLLLQFVIFFLLFALSCWNLEYEREVVKKKIKIKELPDIGFFQDKTKVVMKKRNLNDTYDFMDEESDDGIYYSEPEFGRNRY